MEGRTDVRRKCERRSRQREESALSGNSRGCNDHPAGSKHAAVPGRRAAADDQPAVFDRGGTGGGSKRPQGRPAIAEILRYVTHENTHYAICRGLRRFRVVEFLSGFPYLVARVEDIGISEVLTPEVEARMRLLKTRTKEAVQLLPNLPPEIPAAIDSLDSPSGLA